MRPSPSGRPSRPAAENGWSKKFSLLPRPPLYHHLYHSTTRRLHSRPAHLLELLRMPFSYLTHYLSPLCWSSSRYRSLWRLFCSGQIYDRHCVCLKLSKNIFTFDNNLCINYNIVCSLLSLEWWQQLLFTIQSVSLACLRARLWSDLWHEMYWDR